MVLSPQKRHGKESKEAVSSCVLGLGAGPALPPAELEVLVTVVSAAPEGRVAPAH